jgi:hypothetical protein
MMASIIGKIFLKEYNKRKNTMYSAKDFFVKEFYPLFLDHPKYMQWVTNSPFVQGIRKGRPPTPQERNEKLKRLIEKLTVGPPDASVAIGYPSMDEMATTSGQLTDLNLRLNEDDYYASWIGAGLGVGVQGGYSIYFDNPEILWRIHEGWTDYRNRLNQIDQLRGNQIESWNGQWLAYTYRGDSLEGELFDPLEKVQSGQYRGMIEVPTVKWTEIFIGLARTYPKQILNGYVFSLGQTNVTVGFILFNLPEIQKPIQFYIELFGKSDYLRNARLIRSLYGTAFGFVQACQMGVIGVRAMQPKDLRPYMIVQRGKSKIPDYSKEDTRTRISFKTYQTWLLAMLDNKQLWDKAGEAAESLIQYRLDQKRVRTDRDNDVKKVLEVTQQKSFIDALTVLVEKEDKNSTLVELGKIVHDMPKDNVPYFLTLIRFRYAEKLSQMKTSSK